MSRQELEWDKMAAEVQELRELRDGLMASSNKQASEIDRLQAAVANARRAGAAAERDAVMQGFERLVADDVPPVSPAWCAGWVGAGNHIEPRAEALRRAVDRGVELAEVVRGTCAVQVMHDAADEVMAELRAVLAADEQRALDGQA